MRESTIAGVHVIFKAGHSNGLHGAFHTPREQKLDPAALPSERRALLIACDTLEINADYVRRGLREWRERGLRAARTQQLIELQNDAAAVALQTASALA